MMYLVKQKLQNTKLLDIKENSEGYKENPKHWS